MKIVSALEEFHIEPFDDWRDFAQCTGHATLFFAKKSERPEARDRREAKALQLCRACPVQLICRAVARDRHEYGFWGGESEDDRHRAGYCRCSAVHVRTGLTAVDDAPASAC